MPRITTASAVLVLLSACVATVPIKQSAVTQEVAIEHDRFKNQTWIRTPLYLSRQGFTDTFPVRLSWRALYKDKQAQFIQLYVTKTDMTWGFFSSANGEDGHKFEFTKVDSAVNRTGTLVTTEEHFALTVPRAYLQKMAGKDWEIKAYGQRNEGVFVVPAAFTNGFLDKVICYEQGSCS